MVAMSFNWTDEFHKLLLIPHLSHTVYSHKFTMVIPEKVTNPADSPQNRSQDSSARTISSKQDSALQTRASRVYTSGRSCSCWAQLFSIAINPH